VVEGHLVSEQDLGKLPASFVASPPLTDARFAFLAGGQNLCFLPESQERTFDYFDSNRSGYHTFYRAPEYGHLDVFMGKDAARDVFPWILKELQA
ncbi:MAG: esterase, partial [Actinomycetota bacterium]